jgi:hypothetical protein
MFFKKGRGALWVCIWNQGGGGPKKFGNHCSIPSAYTIKYVISEAYVSLNMIYFIHAAAVDFSERQMRS